MNFIKQYVLPALFISAQIAAAGITALLILAAIIMINGCGTSNKMSGGTTHTVQGEAVIRHEIDIEICDDLKGKDKADCIKAIVAAITEQVDEPANVTGDE